MKYRIKSAGLLVPLVMITGVVFISCAGLSTTQAKTYKIGDKGPAGGWIFYDKGSYSDGWRYLEVAPDDQGGADWGCSDKSISGAQGKAIGTGKSNTQAIIKSCGEENIAAKLCTEYRGGGKSDWFLPSKDELDLMYKNLSINGVGCFDDYYYWSSSEGADTTAWTQDMRTGKQFYARDKDDYYDSTRVRAVRAF